MLLTAQKNRNSSDAEADLDDTCIFFLIIWSICGMIQLSECKIGDVLENPLVQDL